MTFLHKLAQRLARMKTPILMGVLLTTACEQIPAAGPTGTQEPVVVASVASVSVTPGAVSATTGQTVQLTAIPRDATGRPLLGRTVTWRSSNTAVVTVSASGLATGVPAGSATITATSEGKSGTAAITVTLTPAPVASLSVTPATASVPTGQTVQLTATLRDASGNVLIGREGSIGWGSNNTGVAIVNGSGLVTALVVGAATITASSDGKSAAADFAIQPPSTWPNEPAGFTVRNDYGWSDPLPTGNSVPVGSSGWSCNNGGLATRVSDATVPTGAPYVMQMAYPTGFAGGSGPANCWYILSPSAPELYLGFWWKASTPWQGHNSNVNKIMYLMHVDANIQNQAVLEMYGPPGGPYALLTVMTETGVTEPRNFAEANVSDATLVPGTWYRIEVYLKYGTNSTSNNGILKQWVNGVLVTNYSDFNFFSDGVNQVTINPTWGGITDVKTENDYFRFGTVHTSTR
jgi:hypothetical protein